MKDILNNLYSYEYFGFYLIISIIVLIILFLIILFFGKKDQKIREIEATKKLQQINDEAFKEENTTEKLEVNKSQEELENNTIIINSIEDIPSFNNIESDNEIPDPILPTLNDAIEENTNSEAEQKQIEIIESKNEIEEQPLLEKIEEKPFAFENTSIFNSDFIKTEEPIQIEEIKPVVEEVEVPEFNFDEIVKDVEEVKNVDSLSKGPQIFSSVYVPEKKEEVEEIFEIPKKSEELEFELPLLKKEEVKEDIIKAPELKEYNLDDLSGESYTINK